MSTAEDTRRLLCSLAWLRGNEKLLEDTLLIDDKVTQEVADVLANPTCYMKVFHSIFPIDTLEEKADGTFWPLIHVLACRGVYVVNEGQSVTHTILSQTKPFEVSTHLALIDALMRAYVLAVVKIPHVMRVVRRVSTVTAAHELPATAEEALLLWLSKVSEAVMCTRKDKIFEKNSHALQERSQQVDRVIARQNGLFEAVTGGQSLPALLVHYHQQDFKFKDFHFRGTHLTHEEALKNTIIFANFARRKFPFHIKPEVLVCLGTDPLLHTNVLALLARIFEYFELSSTSQTESVSRSKKSKPFSQKDDFIGSSSVKGKGIGEFKNEPLLPLRMKCIRSLTKDDKGKQLSEDSKKLHLENSLPYSMHKEWVVSLKNSKDIPIRDDLERSFTVDKQHTIDSATKAGLPIIENSDTLLPTEESTECLHNSRSLVQVLPQPGSSLISQGCLFYMSNHMSVYTVDAPGKENVNFEHYLIRTMQDLEGSLGGCNIKSVWRERLKNRQTSCAASLPVPSFKPTLTTVSQNVNVQTASATVPPLTASTVILQCPQNPGQGVENPPNLSGNPWLPEGSRIALSPPHKKDLQAKHHHLLREKIEKRLNDRKKAKRREKITQRESIESQSDSSEQPSSFITHNGPECYVKPPAKSNRQLIKNAICHVCLAGDVNLSSKQRALTELETSSALHFFILFKHVISFKFRALYSYSEGKVCKIFGSGPQVVQECMIDQFYKYNCGSKEFSKIHSYSFSLSVDAFTLKQEAWALRRV